MKEQTTQAGSTATLYTSIHKLMFDRFEDAFVDGDLKALIICGEPTEQELQEAWLSIREQYADALADTQQKRFISIFKDLQKLKIKQMQALTLISVLETCYVEKFTHLLNKLFHKKLKFDINNLDSYHADLKRMHSHAKGISLHIQLKEIELAAFDEKNSSGAHKPTRDYFAGILINLSDHAGYAIRKNELSTYDFCQRVRRYKDHINKLQATKK